MLCHRFFYYVLLSLLTRNIWFLPLPPPPFINFIFYHQSRRSSPSRSFPLHFFLSLLFIIIFRASFFSAFFFSFCLVRISSYPSVRPSIVFKNIPRPTSSYDLFSFFLLFSKCHHLYARGRKARQRGLFVRMLISLMRIHKYFPVVSSSARLIVSIPIIRAAAIYCCS